MNHRIFERTLRLVVFRWAYLFERHFNPQALLGIGRPPAWCALKSVAVPPGFKRSITFRALEVRLGMLAKTPILFSWLTSDQVGLPAELKHINKRRKRNQQGLP